MVTSRFDLVIEQKFGSDSVLEVRACKEDVRQYVAGQMPDLPNCVQRDNELKLAVQNDIAEAVDGL